MSFPMPASVGVPWTETARSDSDRRRKSSSGSATIEPAAFGLTNEINGIQRRIQNFAERGENWNGYDVAAPDPAAIEKAKRWIGAVYSLALRHGWQEPLVSPDENGAIAFEWQRGARWLSVIVAANAVTFLREGNWPEGESETGFAETPAQQETVWKWLMA